MGKPLVPYYSLCSGASICTLPEVGVTGGGGGGVDERQYSYSVHATETGEKLSVLIYMNITKIN